MVNWFTSLMCCFQEGPQRKKRKSEVVLGEEKADLLAMGTAAGSVLIYSTVKGVLHCTLVSPALASRLNGAIFYKLVCENHLLLSRY